MVLDEGQIKNWTEMAALLIRKLEKPNLNFDLLSNIEALKKFSAVLFEKVSFKYFYDQLLDIPECPPEANDIDNGFLSLKY